MIVRPNSWPMAALLVLGLSGCAAAEDERAEEVVVGLTTDLAVGFDIHRVEITSAAGGAVEEQLWSYTDGDLKLPAELRVEAGSGETVEVTVEAFGETEAQPFVTRSAATTATPGRVLFLPISLEQACSGVECKDGATCVEGACVDPFAAPTTLEEYDPSWIEAAPDACKTPSSGSPAIDLGQGVSGFTPLAEGQEVPIEAGAQGGYHMWLALRVNGLRQMGSRLTVQGAFPDLDVAILPVTMIATLRRAEEGPCEIYGVRFRVDAGLPVETIRGQALDVEVHLKDPNGDSATATRRVVIAP